MPYKRTILVGLSDTHGGHKLGLCNPNVLLQQIENGEIKWVSPQLSETQKWMYEAYEWGISEVISLAGKDEIVLIHDGDPTHGKASFLELMSSRMSDQILIAQSNFEIWTRYKNLKAIRFAVGTGIHEMGEGSSSILINNYLQGKYPKLNTSVVYHGVLTIQSPKRNFVVDFSHHGANTGSRTWLTGNEMRYYLRSIMIRELMDGKTPADLYLRGHYHTYMREYLEIAANGNTHESWMVLLPGFTFKDDYTRRVTRSEFKQSIGMVAFELLDGKLYDTHKLVRTVDIRTKEIL
jgi:hypothetical protein